MPQLIILYKKEEKNCVLTIHCPTMWAINEFIGYIKCLIKYKKNNNPVFTDIWFLCNLDNTISGITFP